MCPCLSWLHLLIFFLDFFRVFIYVQLALVFLVYLCVLSMLAESVDAAVVGGTDC